MQEIFEQGKFILNNENPNEVPVEYKTLLTFKHKNDINYVIYSDDTYDELGNLNIYASKYKNDETELESIETEEEWQLIDQVLFKEIVKVQSGQ